MSVNKYNSQAGTLETLASGSRIWIGSEAAYQSEKQAGTLPSSCMICITDDEVDTCHYSTDETFTGMYWIDGKPIYRKILTETRNGQGNWDFSETISNVEKFIKINLLTHGSNDYQESCDSHYYFTRARLDNSSTNTYSIECTMSSGYSLAGLQYCILEYTKVTD